MNHEPPEQQEQGGGWCYPEGATDEQKDTIKRLRHFEANQNKLEDRYGSEVLYHARREIIHLIDDNRTLEARCDRYAGALRELIVVVDREYDWCHHTECDEPFCNVMSKIYNMDSSLFNKDTALTDQPDSKGETDA